MCQIYDLFGYLGGLFAVSDSWSQRLTQLLLHKCSLWFDNCSVSSPPPHDPCLALSIMKLFTQVENASPPVRVWIPSCATIQQNLDTIVSLEYYAFCAYIDLRVGWSTYKNNYFGKPHTGFLGRGTIDVSHLLLKPTTMPWNLQIWLFIQRKDLIRS